MSEARWGICSCGAILCEDPRAPRATDHARHRVHCMFTPKWETYARFERRLVLTNLRAELENVEDAVRYLSRRQRELVPSTRTEVCMDVRRRVEDGEDPRAACDAELALLNGGEV